MLHTISILAAMSTTGLLGHGKHCGGGRMHHARAQGAQCTAPVVTCGTAANYSTPMIGSAVTPNPTPQGQAMTMPAAPSKAPVYATPSQAPSPAVTVPPAPVVPPAPIPPAPPSS